MAAKIQDGCENVFLLLHFGIFYIFFTYIIIVKKALELSCPTVSVEEVADDTDIFMLLFYHANRSSNISLSAKQHTISIRIAQEVLEKELCMCILFLHAMSGCDTTSAFYGIWKIKHLNVLQSSQILRSKIVVFGEIGTTKQDIRDVLCVVCGNAV